MDLSAGSVPAPEEPAKRVPPASGAVSPSGEVAAESATNTVADTAATATGAVAKEPVLPRETWLDKVLQGRLKGLTWPWGVGIIVVSVLIETLVWWYYEDERTWQGFSLWVWFGGMQLALLVWWLFFSGVSWATRGIGVVLAAGLGLLFFLLFRIENYSGDMLPNFGWRFRTSPQRRAERYWKDHSAAPVAKPSDENPADPKGETAEGLRIVVTPADWPAFRGPRNDGIALSPIRLDWTKQPPQELWRHPVGAGWSSFAAVGEYIFTQEQRGEKEAIVCYELDSGREVWKYDYVDRFKLDPSGEGPRATPTIHDGLLYAVGARGWLHCLDVSSGKVKWSHETLKEAGYQLLPDWGIAWSPLVYDDVVVVNPGGPNGQAVVAYDRRTGKKKWSGGSDRSSYASPQLVELCGQRQLLIFDAVGLAGHDPNDGRELWKFPWSNKPMINVAQPLVVGSNRVLASTGYSVGSVLLEITPPQTDSAQEHDPARGPDKAGEFLFKATHWTCSPVWTSRDLKLKFNGAVLARDGFVYGLDDGILVCLDVTTGKRRWKQGRYGYGQLLLSGEHLVILAERGDVALVKTSPDHFLEVARFHALDETTWNVPVIHRGRLLVRNSAEAACFDLSLPVEK